MTETLDDVVNRLGVVEKIVSRLSKFLPQDLFLSIAAGRIDVLNGHDIPAGMEPPNSFVQPFSCALEQHDMYGEQRDHDSFLPSRVEASSDEEVAMMLEDFAVGNRINRHRATLDLLGDQDRPNEYPWQTHPHTMDLGANSLPTPPTPSSVILPFCLSEFHPFSLFVESSTNIIARLVSILPRESQTKELIKFYVSLLLSFLRLYSSLTITFPEYRSLTE